MKKWILFLASLAYVRCLAAEDTFALYARVQDAWKKNDYATVLRLTEQMIKQCPGHSGVQFQYARALAANGKSEDSQIALERSARMGGSPPAETDQLFDSLKLKNEFRKILDAFQRNRISSGRSEIAFRVPGKDLIPEGITYDPVDKKYYIGSTYQRKIIQVDSAGKVQDFTTEKQDGLWGVVGIEVDPERRLLWANTANAGATMAMKDPESETQGKTAIFKYDLRTGKLIKKYETGSKDNPRFLNDVAISSHGDVYISESTAGEIYKIDASRDVLELLIPGGSMGFPNGIAISEDNKFLYVSHLEGITVIDLASGNRQLLIGPEDTQLGGQDGMVYYRNSLIGIQSLTGGVERVVRLYLQDPKRVKRLEVLQVNHPLFELPTTGVMVGEEFHYIANSQLHSFDEKGNIFPSEKLNETVILKVRP
jgi:sugar lactone lactonase YvrE